MREKRRSVLIVNDAPEEGAIYRRYLTQDSNHKYRIQVASSGARALAICRRRMPHCLLLDRRLPDLSVEEVLRALMAEPQAATCAVVLLAGSEDVSQASGAMKSGAHDVLEKSLITPDLLRRAVACAIEKAELQRQLEEQRRDLCEKNRLLEGRLAELQREVAERRVLEEMHARFLEQEQSRRSAAEKSLWLQAVVEQRLMLLVEAASSLIRSLNINEVLPVILETARLLLVSDAYAVWRLQPSGQWHPIASDGLSDRYIREAVDAAGLDLALPGAPIAMEDPDDPAEPAQMRRARNREGIRSLLVMPLSIQGCNCATLAFYYRQSRRFTGEEMRVAGALAGLMASALSTAELYDDQVRLRREAEERERELRESQSRLKLAIAAARAGAWEMDLETKRIEWSEELYAVFDQTPNSSRPTVEGWLEWMHQDDRERGQAVVDAIREGGQEFRIEYRTLWPRGDVRWLESRGVALRDEHGKPVRMFGITSDITERKRAEEKMRESEERYRTIVETANDGVWLIDLEARTLYLNHRLAAMLGYEPSEMIGRKMQEFCFDEDRPEALERIAGDLSGCHEAFDFRFRRKDGGELPVIASTSPVRDGRGRVTGTLGMFTDITERKQIEMEREELLASERAARESAEEASRAKDEFLAVISHELRSPLNAMLGWAKLLQKGGVDPDTLARAIDVIERNASSQQQLIEDLLDTARIISGKLRLETMPVDLAQVVEAAANVVRPAAEAKEIDLRLWLNGDCEITGDPGRLQQVVWNLLSNAVKFTPEGGRAEVHLRREGPYVQLNVSDTGSGIRPDVLPHVFDRFRQADSSSTRRYGGLGLGLALVRHLVELHGGAVNADSPGEGRGATFTIRLPVRAIRRFTVTADRADRGGDKLPIDPRLLEDVWVLVVDDEADARELISMLLKQYGARVTATPSASEAFAIICQGESGARPDVIVSDISMPGEDGYTLIERVRDLPFEEGGGIPAIALTAFERTADRVRALTSGYQMHVPKPVEPEELTMVVATVTGRTGRAMGA